MFELLDETPKDASGRKTGWASMNAIQKSGVIGFFVLLFGSLPFSGKTTAPYMEVCAQTSLFFGWVAGSLWKVRHALHFWWSLVIATLGHLCLIPTYLRISRYYDSGHHSGREVGLVIVGMIAAETILFVTLLKKVAMWAHGRSHQIKDTGYIDR
jgi:hypothetical protein